MVILQFNKLIRNKWVWGVFAIAVSAAFCLDDVFRPSGNDADSTAPLENLSVKYDAALEAECRDAIRLTAGDVDRFDRMEELYGYYAAAASFDDAGVAISDAELGQYLNANYLARFENDQAMYKQWVQDRFGMDVARFERTWRRALQIERGVGLYEVASTWVSPMELDQLRHDASDVFSVRVATFNQDEMLADAGKIEPDVGAWYSNNLSRVSVPVTYTFNYVEFSPESTNLLAACQASEAEIKARYEADPMKIYFTTNAAGEKVAVKQLEEVSASIAETLAKDKFVETYTKLFRKRCNDANDAFYADKSSDKRSSESLVSVIAAEYGLAVKTAENVALEPKSDLVFGLVTPASSVFSGTANRKMLKRLAPSADDQRYALLKDTYTRRVWLVETVAENAATKVALADCQDKISGLALADKREELYKEAVKKVIEKGADEVIKVGKAPAAVVSSRNDPAGLPFGVISQLNKGDVSDLIDGKVYVCVGRNAGDYDALAAANREAYDTVLSMRPLDNRMKWMSSNLKRLGYVGKDASKN